MNTFNPIIPKIFKPFDHLIALQTTRYGGNSKGDYFSLNLGKNTNDDPQLVQSNYEILKKEIGISDFVLSHQIHGDQILEAEFLGIYTGYDSIITKKSNLFIGITIADCCPILIFDCKHNVIAAIHAGWKGTIQKLVLKTLNLLYNKHNTHPKDCFAYIGACISERNFEVGNDVADNFSPKYKIWDEKRNKFLVNLKEANTNQCREFGIPNHQIEISDLCTFEDDQLLYSHRKSGGVTGRMLCGIAIKSN